MNDDTAPSLDAVVSRFVSAEQALLDLRTEQSRLLDATTRFISSDDEMRGRTATALEALEEARARLRQQILSGEEITKDTGDLHRSLSEAVTEIGQVLQTLRSIDPAAMSRDLADLRRDGADNASEVRELRRLTAELQRTHDQLTISHAALVSEHNNSIQRLRLLVPVGLATLAAAIAAVVVGLVR